MAKRILLLVLMLWAGYGVLRLSMSEDAAGPGVDELPLVYPEVVEPGGVKGGEVKGGEVKGGEVEVRLAARSEDVRETDAENAAGAEPLIEFLLRTLQVKAVTSDETSRVELLRLYRDAATLMSSQVQAVRDATPQLLTALPGERAATQVAVLGALSQHDALSDAQCRALRTFAYTSDVHETPAALADMLGLAGGSSMALVDLDKSLFRLLDDVQRLPGDRAMLRAPLLRLAAMPSVRRASRVRLLDELRALAPEDPGVLRATLLALSDRGRIRARALAWLREGGEARRRAFRELLVDARGIALVLGAEYLLRGGCEPQQIGRLVLPALHDANAEVRDRAVLLLARAAQPASDVAPHVEKLFAGENPALWLTGLRALGAIRREPEDQRVAIDLLFVAVRLPDVQVRTVAVQTLLMQQGHHDRILALFTELLRDSVVQVRKEAVDGLGELSTQNPEALAHLQVALGDADKDVRALARYWLTEEPEEDDGDD